MFGLFDSDAKRVRALRSQYEDIRQRVLYKMNPYQQYAFASGYQSWLGDLEESLGQIATDDLAQWREMGEVVKAHAQKSWNASRQMSGLAGEGAIAGAEALALIALHCAAKGYVIAEALTLRSDISAFIEKIDRFIEERGKPGTSEWFPKD
ncbi:hypothetical protein FKO01_19005 [Mesorhizobium sp. B2-3-3]|nr:hypothetical protein FKO01_19005 [Mesorhizobium sp. B2-3-3]